MAKAELDFKFKSPQLKLAVITVALPTVRQALGNGGKRERIKRALAT